MQEHSSGVAFKYSRSFEELIEAICAPKREWPNYPKYLADHLGSPLGRYVRFKLETLPEIEYHCGNLSSREVLDFGCGTGSTTAALAERAQAVVAYDIDEQRIAIARRRLQEHGLQDRATFVLDAPFQCRVDVAVLNGVVEHIPASQPGLREAVLSHVAEAVRPEGFIFINDTPNRLFPVDLHTTQLWWIPWTRPGSQWAYKRALKAQRFFDAPDLTPGTRGLEEAGAWGSTYWSLQSYFYRHGFTCLNLEKGHDRRLRYCPQRASKLRGLFEALVYPIGPKSIKAPLTAFMPNLNNLVFQRRAR